MAYRAARARAGFLLGVLCEQREQQQQWRAVAAMGPPALAFAAGRPPFDKGNTKHKYIFYNIAQYTQSLEKFKNNAEYFF
jgi:hypothetical protein